MVSTSKRKKWNWPKIKHKLIFSTTTTSSNSPLKKYHTNYVLRFPTSALILFLSFLPQPQPSKNLPKSSQPPLPPTKASTIEQNFTKPPEMEQNLIFPQEIDQKPIKPTANHRKNRNPVHHKSLKITKTEDTIIIRALEFAHNKHIKDSLNNEFSSVFSRIFTSSRIGTSGEGEDEDEEPQTKERSARLIDRLLALLGREDRSPRRLLLEPIFVDFWSSLQLLRSLEFLLCLIFSLRLFFKKRRQRKRLQVVKRFCNLKWFCPSADREGSDVWSTPLILSLNWLLGSVGKDERLFHAGHDRRETA